MNAVTSYVGFILFKMFIFEAYVIVNVVLSLFFSTYKYSRECSTGVSHLRRGMFMVFIGFTREMVETVIDHLIPIFRFLSEKHDKLIHHPPFILIS